MSSFISASRVCNESFHLLPHASQSLVLHASQGIYSDYCVIKIYAEDPAFRVRLTFDTAVNFFHKDIANCNRSYLHLGNNMNSVDVETLTSYRVCLDSPLKEFVSRGPSAWLVLSSKMSSAFLTFSYEILPESIEHFLSFFHSFRTFP